MKVIIQSDERLHSTKCDHNVASAESVIRTMRHSVVRIIEDKGPAWTDQIKSIVQNYHEGSNSAIKMTPLLAKKEFPLSLTNIVIH